MCQGIYEPKNLVFYESHTSVAKLNPDQAFEGYTFLTLKWHEEELYNLADKDRKQFLEDMSLVANALSKALKPDKMNYELLGNSATSPLALDSKIHIGPNVGTAHLGWQSASEEAERGRIYGPKAKDRSEYIDFRNQEHEACQVE